MSVRVLAVTPRSSLVLALTMLVPDWDVDAATDAAQVVPGDGFDVLVIEATRTDEGLATLRQLRSAGVDQPAVVAGDILPDGDVGALVIARPFTVQELCERIMGLVHPPVVEDPPIEVPEPAVPPPDVTIDDEPTAEPPKRHGLLAKLRRPHRSAIEAPIEADTSPLPDPEPVPADPEPQPPPVAASPEPVEPATEREPKHDFDPEPITIEPPPAPPIAAAPPLPPPPPAWPVEPTPVAATVAPAPPVVATETPPVAEPTAVVSSPLAAVVPEALAEPEDEDDLAGFEPVALLAELVNAFDPVTAAIWVQDDAQQWRVIEQIGLRRAEAGRAVPTDQPFFAAISNELHGILLSPADLARGYLGGVPGTWTEDVMAAPVAHRRECLAIVVIGGDELTERATRQLASLTGAATDRPSLRRFRRRLSLLTARI